jgi:hypothetical protein
MAPGREYRCQRRSRLRCRVRLLKALRCFSASSYEASALMCRRSLEALCKSFTARGKSLQAKLDALHAMEVIDKQLTQWAHGVKAIGNEAAHDTDTELSKDDARDTLDFTGGLCMYSC